MNYILQLNRSIMRRPEGSRGRTTHPGWLDRLVFLLLLAFNCSQTGAQVSLSVVNSIPLVNAFTVAASKQYLYAATASGVRVFDLSNPCCPVDVGFRDNSGWCYSVAISDGYLYATESALTVYSISNPTNPVPVAQIWAGLGVDATVNGNYLYLSRPSLSPSYVSIYDISTPDNPVAVGQIQTVKSDVPVAVSGNYAFVPDGSAGLQIYDVSDPTNPVLNGVEGDPAGFWNVVPSQGYAYTSFATNSLGIFNIANPTNPIALFQSEPHRCCSMALYGNYLVSENAYGSAELWDVSNPTNTLLLQNIYLDEGFYVSHHTIALRQGYAYVARGTLFVLSLGTPPAPPLSIADSATNTVVLSWPAPSAPFAVQETADLTTGSWVSLTNTPVVIGSQNQVTVEKKTRSGFYRLAWQ